MRRAWVGFFVVVLVGSIVSGAESRPDPMQLVPQTDSTLLAIRQDKDGKRIWMRVDPVAGKESVVATLPRGGEVTWNHEGTKALVWQSMRFEPDGKKAPPLLEVDLKTGELRELPPPTKGSLSLVGFDAAGVVHAFTRVDGLRKRKNGRFRFEGRSFQAGEMDESLATNYRLTAQGQWQLVDAAGTWDQQCDAPASELPQASMSWRLRMRRAIPRRSRRM